MKDLRGAVLLKKSVPIILATLAFSSPTRGILGREPTSIAEIFRRPPVKIEQGLLEAVGQEASFARGELLDAGLVQKVTDLFLLSLQKVPTSSKELGAWLSQKGTRWWTLFEQVSYNEENADILRWSLKMRMELLRTIKKNLEGMAEPPPKQVHAWASGLMFRLPLDRIFLFHSRQIWRDQNRIFTNRVVDRLQKNSNQSLLAIFKAVRVPEKMHHEELLTLWSDSDVSQQSEREKALKELQILLTQRSPQQLKQ